MADDVYEPLSRYRDEFREKFARLTREKFAELTERSGVDVAANRRQVALIKALDARLSSARFKRTLLCILMIIGFAGALVGGFLATRADADETVRSIAPLVAVFGVVLGVGMAILFAKAGKAVDELVRKIREAKEVAWRQMEPLNRLYTWNLTVGLIEATVPRLDFDPFFTAQRLADLRRLYGWDDSFNRGKSVLFAQSGIINGNPFLLGECREMRWVQHTYTGSLSISWRELERDADGKTRMVTRHQTLHASVEKPVPSYPCEKVLIYGNDAAEALSFSRDPSGLDAGGLGTTIRKWWRLRGLRSFSRNLDDESQFTLMNNEEFETWFHAKDRDNEVEFRLLFTALAQIQMLALMKDRETGFGDDFRFVKRCKLNFLFPKHLQDATIDTDPSRFRNWDYDAAAAFFRSFNEAYFRNVYFALAPLLAIPLYQQTRTHEEIWKGVVGSDASSFWEHESIANYFGGDRFRHPESITENILKTRVLSRQDGVSTVAVTAHGFRGEDRVDYVSVYGGDGCWHDVPVEWTEYLPVERTRNMTVTEADAPSNTFRARFESADVAAIRRTIRSYL